MMMAVWRIRPKTPVMIYSDQGSQFGSDGLNRRCKDNQLVSSMSRRENCWDNAVGESFFSSLKKERIKRRIHACWREAKADVFDYIEGFCNRVRRHSSLSQPSPLAFEHLRTGSSNMSTAAGEVQIERCALHVAQMFSSSRLRTKTALIPSDPCVHESEFGQLPGQVHS